MVLSRSCKMVICLATRQTPGRYRWVCAEREGEIEWRKAAGKSIEGAAPSACALSIIIDFKPFIGPLEINHIHMKKSYSCIKQWFSQFHCVSFRIHVLSFPFWLKRSASWIGRLIQWDGTIILMVTVLAFVCTGVRVAPQAPLDLICHWRAQFHSFKLLGNKDTFEISEMVCFAFLVGEMFAKLLFFMLK